MKLDDQQEKVQMIEHVDLMFPGSGPGVSVSAEIVFLMGEVLLWKRL